MAKLPPLNPLRAFEATARHLSVSGAAAELSVTHGAVSRQIRVLEDALRIRLFLRQNGKFKLSSYGSTLLPAVSGAFNSIAEAVALLTQQRSSGDLVVSCASAALSFWVIPRLGRFADQHPGIRLRFANVNCGERVLGDVDIGLHYGHGSWPDLHVQLWSRVNLFPVCSPALINARPLRKVADLSSHTLLHSYDAREWQSWLLAAREPLPMPEQSYVMPNNHLALEAAIHGHGVAIGDSITASALLSDGRLIRPFRLQIPASGAYYILCRKELQKTPTVKAFSDWLFYELAQRHAGPGPTTVRTSPSLTPKRMKRRRSKRNPKPVRIDA